MNVNPISSHYIFGCKPLNSADVYNQTFTGKINTASEIGTQKCEYGLRIIANKFDEMFESKASKAITKLIASVTPNNDAKYLAQLEEISSHYASKKCIDVNIEDKILEKIASKNDAVIFIMNHSNQAEDPQMLAVLNSLLVDAYKSAGRENSFPIPKIILNQDILTTMNPTKRKAFEAFGAVGIDANVLSADKKTNTRAFLPLIKDFIRNKCNIFIFPEGKLAVKRNLPLEERFQSGVAEIVNKVLGIKKSVTVVPVGFSYGKGENKLLNGMQIGAPVTFKREGDITTTTAGSLVSSKYADEGFVKFFTKNDGLENVPITKGGHPVKNDDIVDYIKSILCENLHVVSREAKDKLAIPFDSTLLTKNKELDHSGECYTILV